MGLFSWGKKKEPSHAFLMPFYDDTLKVLMEFNHSDSIDDDDRCGFVHLMTSASALVLAGYHMKYYIAYSGKVEQKKATEISQNIGKFMHLISEASLKAAEKETNGKYDRATWTDKIINVQHDKTKAYSVAILKTIEKGRMATGIDISDVVTQDLYGESVSDILLAGQLLSIVSQVTD